MDGPGTLEVEATGAAALVALDADEDASPDAADADVDAAETKASRTISTAFAILSAFSPRSAFNFRVALDLGISTGSCDGAGPSAEDDAAEDSANARLVARRDDVRRWYGSRFIS